MNDFCDQAAEREAIFLAEALAKHRLPENHMSRSHCEDCGEPIPGARQQAVKRGITDASISVYRNGDKIRIEEFAALMQ